MYHNVHIHSYFVYCSIVVKYKKRYRNKLYFYFIFRLKFSLFYIEVV